MPLVQLQAHSVRTIESKLAFPDKFSIPYKKISFWKGFLRQCYVNISITIKHIKSAPRIYFAGKRRQPNTVSQIYDNYYSLPTQDWIKERNDRNYTISYQNQYFSTNGWFSYYCFNQFISNVIRQSKAQSILEMGSGRGTHTLSLAMKHPDLKFIGLEDSSRGVLQGQEMAAKLPQELVRIFGPENISSQDLANINKRVMFVQGNALKMPFPDKHFDLSFSSLVLEQMPNVYPQVCRELRRVTRSYCVLIEPFREANHWFQKLHLKNVDYFRFSYKKLHQYGLKPIYFSASLPNKLKYGIGVLVAQVIDDPSN